LEPQKIARVTGVLFLITFISIAIFALYGPVLDDPRYILGSGADMSVRLGAFIEVIVAIACIGTAVVVYPIVKRQSEGVALGYVTSRVVEAMIIIVGVFSLLSIVTLRQDLAGAAGTDAASLVIAGKSLVAFHDWTFLLGPGFLSGVGNGMLLGYLMYRSGLVPRRMALMGIVGGSLVAASGIAVLFGLYEQVSTWSAIATVPEFLWEGSLGIYLIVKGFRPSAVTTLQTREPATEPSLVAA